MPKNYLGCDVMKERLDTPSTTSDKWMFYLLPHSLTEIRTDLNVTSEELKLFGIPSVAT